MSENTQLSTVMPSDLSMGVFSSASMYGEYHRIAVDISKGDLIPEAFRGKPANIMIALNLASRMGADPLAIMQSMYIVYGKPSFSASFIGGIVEESGKFGFLEYRYQGTPDKDDYGCRIVTIIQLTGQEIQGPLVTIAMAKAEGWYTKKGSKWPVMPELMLGNRAITFFARRYAGSVLIGMSSTDELQDMDVKDINPGAGQEKMSKADMADSLVGQAEVVVETKTNKSDAPRATPNKKDEEKPVTTEKEKDTKKTEAEQKLQDDQKQEDEPVNDNPWTADGLVKVIEKAADIDTVNKALSLTSGFLKADSNRVLKAAVKKNKELAAARNKA